MSWLLDLFRQTEAEQKKLAQRVSAEQLERVKALSVKTPYTETQILDDIENHMRMFRLDYDQAFEVVEQRMGAVKVEPGIGSTLANDKPDWYGGARGGGSGAGLGGVHEVRVAGGGGSGGGGDPWFAYWKRLGASDTEASIASLRCRGVRVYSIRLNLGDMWSAEQAEAMKRVSARAVAEASRVEGTAQTQLIDLDTQDGAREAGLHLVSWVCSSGCSHVMELGCEQAAIVAEDAFVFIDHTTKRVGGEVVGSGRELHFEQENAVRGAP